MRTNYQDTFARDRLPPIQMQPSFLYDHPDFQYPPTLNCVTELLDRHIVAGNGDRIAFYDDNGNWTYQRVFDTVNAIANVLIDKCNLVSGNRVLLRGYNNPMMAMIWLAIVKAGGIAVTTMPLLMSKELRIIGGRAAIALAVTDYRLVAQVQEAGCFKQIVTFGDQSLDSLDVLITHASKQFTAFVTAAEDIALIGFTSGTTGRPKATAHYHKDVLTIAKTFPYTCLQMSCDDICIGSPPLGFTFGLGGLLIFPLYYGAATVLLEKAVPDILLAAIRNYRATICFTAPTHWRNLLKHIRKEDVYSLRRCVSAGEALSRSLYDEWLAATGIPLIDGIGATEMLHIFIASPIDDIRPGATGKPVHGYRAQIVDEQMRPLPPNIPGQLAVQGPTGCRYLDDERQQTYVRDGWNITGDIYRTDEDGYFWYIGRNDDMIISAGYNIAAAEVEEGLLQHEAVCECAVVGVPDEERGHVVKAFIVLNTGHTPCESFKKVLQDFSKSVIAPYKYPRLIEFVDVLPKTETGKIQRFRLRDEGAVV